MIITTTMHIENKPVQEYKGIVFGEVVEGRNFVKDFMSGIRDIVGGRSGSYEDSLMSARQRNKKGELPRKNDFGSLPLLPVIIQQNHISNLNSSK